MWINNVFLLCTLNLCKYDLPRGCRTLPGGIHRKPSYKQSKPLLAVYTSVEGDIHPHPGKSKEREKLTGIAYIQSLKNTPLKYMSKANDLYDTYLLTYLTHISVIENMNPLCHTHKYLQGKGSNKISEGNQMHRQTIQWSLDTAIASKPPPRQFKVTIEVSAQKKSGLPDGQSAHILFLHIFWGGYWP